MLKRISFWIVAIVWLLVVISCTRSAPGSQPWQTAPTQAAALQGDQTGLATVLPAAASTRRSPNDPILTPTPDAPRILPTPRTAPEEYTVRPNDSLGMIAQRFGVTLDALVQANNIANANQLEIGQVLDIPLPNPLPPGPEFKVIPDSELVYGPASADLDLPGYIKQSNGYLSHYQQEIDGRTYDGAEIIARVAKDYSVNPRLLLAVLEYRSGWVTQANPIEESIDYPILYPDVHRKGLYLQLTWTANNLNRGYYLWRAGGVASWVLQDGSIVPVNATINAGTAGVQQYFALLLGHNEWETAVTSQGLFATYSKLFGYPFDYAVEPLVPANLQQPTMQLPFEPGDQWAFTGGPHGGWADGSAWAAIDFAPPSEVLGCVPSNTWEVAVADGLILRADQGAVIQDLDGDGLEQTGWVVLYMHVETRGRVQPGTYLHAGDHIGHPSCEGGVSTGTHLHLARRYNGEWISADGNLPFNLDGWISKGDGVEYNGFLVKNGTTMEAWEGRRTENQISR